MSGCISSDTSVWIDFGVIDAIELPFRLPLTYLMWSEAVDVEIKSPERLRERLLACGLVVVELADEEFWLADDYGERYAGLSPYDSVALAIAKNRGIPLMTGDRRLRRAAADEGVEVIGTIGVLDRLSSEGLVSASEYEECLQALANANGGLVRLPRDELNARLDAIRKAAK